MKRKLCGAHRVSLYFRYDALVLIDDTDFRRLLRIGWDPIIIADRLALGLARARHMLVLPLARAAARFIDDKDWFSFGYARLEDHARERFGRSGRWLRDLRSLAKAVERLPSLGLALTGDDGRAPLGAVAALLIGRVATPETVAAWIDLARRSTVRELRERVRDGPAPILDEQASTGAEPEVELADATTLRFAVPPAIGAAIEEARDLHRAICGGETTAAEFVEALVAEACAGPVTHLPNEGWIGARVPLSTREWALERHAEGWSFLRDVRLEGEELCEPRRILDELERRCRDIERGLATPDATIGALIRLENELELELGDLLARMGESGAWRGLRFSGVGHYAEERLGISRSVAQARSFLSRELRHHPSLRDACGEGRLGFEAARLVLRAVDDEGTRRGRDASMTTLGSGEEDAAGEMAPSRDSLELAWIARAEESTIKRLREELGVVDRERALRREGPSAPLDDETWHRLRSRRAGQSLEHLEDLTRAAFLAPDPHLIVRFRLPLELASLLFSAVRAERGRLQQSVNGSDGTIADELPGSARAALMFSKRYGGVPEWCGLLALIEGFVRTWDDPRQIPRRASDRIYIRDGWRCAAPGCSSRRNLEDHHIVYRSRGGDHSLPNRITLCRFHHQQGEHGELLTCRGKAPLGITWWMGRHGVGGTFRNERRMEEREVSARAAVG